jgi:hypothetical protein
MYTLSTHGIKIDPKMSSIHFFYWWTVFNDERKKRQESANAGAAARQPITPQMMQRMGNLGSRR